MVHLKWNCWCWQRHEGQWRWLRRW